MEPQIQFSPWQQMRLSAMAMRNMQAQQEARRGAGAFLYGQYGEPQQPQGPMMPPALPMPPAQAAPAPGSLSPGGGNPQVTGQPPRPQTQQGGMVMTGQGGIPNLAQQTRPRGIEPFRSLPTQPQQAQAGNGMVPPPPQVPQQAAAPDPSQPVQRPFDLRSIVQGLKRSGVPPEKVMDMMDALAPTMNAENKAELEMFKAQNVALKAANDAYVKALNAATAGRRVDVAAGAEDRRRDQGQQNIDIKRQKEARLKQQAAAAVGGGGNLKSTELIYPKGADGKVDTSAAPIGVRGVTKTGKIVNLDAEGHQVPTLAGASAKEAKASQVNVRDTVRGNLVEGSALNATNRLNEIEKTYPRGTTSILFGASGDSVTSRAGHGALRSTQSKEQQDIDAKWSAFIDEAIPVFTGGLRGSDAFRRFLIEQAPGPGSHPEVVKEKMRLFRENIKGTQKAFANKFKEDPSMWAPGVTAEQVKGGAAASQQGPKKISGDAEYDALPSGTEFIGPDGVTRRKP